MAENFSFDIVSDFDRQELVNAIDQVNRETSQRYDLKGTNTSVELDQENIFIITDSELTLNSVIDILRQKATKRKLSLKIFRFSNLLKLYQEIELNKIINLKKGLNQEIDKKISKEIRNEFKKINVSIQGDNLRVASKSKNDLQLVIKMLDKFEESLNVPLQTNNYR